MVVDCVRSLQRCGVPGLQVVVVDDGSNDGTEQKVRALGDNVLYLRQQNQGPAAARNLGFRHCAGRYLAFVDDDDQWLSDVPARVLGMLDLHPEVDVVFAEARMGNLSEGYRSWIEIAGQLAFLQLPCATPEP